MRFTIASRVKKPKKLEFNYGIGFDLVGRILPFVWKEHVHSINGIETKNFKTLNDIAQALLFKPLKMKDTYFAAAGKMKIPSISLLTTFDLKKQYGGVSLMTNFKDIANLLLVLLNKGNTEVKLRVDANNHEAFELDRYITEENFDKWVLTNWIPGWKGHLHHKKYGLSLLGAVTNGKGSGPENSKETVDLFWAGYGGVAFQIDYRKQMTIYRSQMHPLGYYARWNVVKYCRNQKFGSTLRFLMCLIDSDATNHMYFGDLHTMLDSRNIKSSRN